MFELDFHGRTAIVTGASSGLGACFAKALAEQGANVALLARRIAKLENVARECEAFGVKCLPVACDISNEESIDEAVRTVFEEFKRIDVLINNAGVAEFNNIFDYTTEQWNKVIATDLTGIFQISKRVGLIMKEQNYGRIVNIASMGGVLGGNNEIAYYAAKGGVVNMTRAMASEMARYGILVNGIGPGSIITEMSADMLDSKPAETLKKRTALRRFANPEELCGQMLLFASDKNTYCTGQTIIIDGGLTSRL